MEFRHDPEGGPDAGREPLRVDLQWTAEDYAGFDGAAGVAEVVDLRGRSVFVGVPGTIDVPAKHATITVPAPVLQDAAEVRIVW